MRNQIETPLEIRQFRAQQWRVHRGRMWWRTSLAALTCSAALVGLFRLGRMPLPPGLLAAFVLVPMLLPGLFFWPMPFLALRSSDRWRWDERGIELRGRCYRWRAFQRYRVELGCLSEISGRLWRSGQADGGTCPPPPTTRLADYGVFKIQFRDRLLGRGLWLATDARAADIEALAAFAARHLDPA